MTSSKPTKKPPPPSGKSASASKPSTNRAPKRTATSPKSGASPTFESIKGHVAEAGISGIKGIAEGSAKVDAEHLRGNAQSTAGFQDVLKEGMKKANTSDERMRYARMAEDGDRRQKDSAEHSADRSTTTQRGAMKYVSLFVAVALTALGTLAIAKSQKDK